MEEANRTFNIKWLKKYARSEFCPKEVPRTQVEAKTRINSIASIKDYNHSAGEYLVTWQDCDPTIPTFISKAYIERFMDKDLANTLQAQFSELCRSDSTESIRDDASLGSR